MVNQQESGIRVLQEPDPWRRRYARRLQIVDASLVAWAVAGAYGVRFVLADLPEGPGQEGPYIALSFALAAVWWAMLGLWGARDATILGAGSEEYKRVFATSAWLFGFLAIFSYALRIDTARGFVGLAFPAGAVGLLLGRWLVRQHLTVERKKGTSSSRVLIVGSPSATDHLIRSFRSVPAAGYLPVAAHLPGASSSSAILKEQGVPITGVQPDVPSILEVIDSLKIDAVAVSAGVQMTPQDLRQLGWELAARDIGMILAPALTDVAGPRIHTQPVAGLPLIHVSTPKLTGGKRVAKRTFDIACAIFLCIWLAPLMLVLAVLVKTSSPGPVLYKQERVGLHGTTFKMLKFRSMREGADSELLALLQAQGSTETPLFKVANDPRVTPIGRFLRKYSLDELPQLFNVIGGSMSLVGPRPQREGEVALYDDAAHRRLYVSPGMSGLWQVSGRSNLSWEESIRLDLYYVENWSLMGDIVILFKTFTAVLRTTGAF